ncbi:hypothetical protein V6N12_058305 [Hibiscus sabdariffa]|uniref:RNase H type-1 domain-containing protein n=1 Tax=Hibiscus sabdariffa TaxID=183260 RepID=A0ABR2EUD0_9ROSI
MVTKSGNEYGSSPSHNAFDSFYGSHIDSEYKPTWKECAGVLIITPVAPSADFMMKLYCTDSETVLLCEMFGTASFQPLWKRRNDFIFTGSCSSISEIHHLCSAQASHFQSNHNRQQQTPQLVTVAWTPPSPNWIALNTDASTIQPAGLSFVGGAFRDSLGNWKLGFHQAIGIMSPLHAELRNILIGLHIA